MRLPRSRPASRPGASAPGAPGAPRAQARRAGSARLPEGLRAHLAAAATSAAGGGAEAEIGQRARINFTRRAVVLASALCAVVLLLAYPLRQYAGHRGEIAQLRQQNEAASRRVAALSEQQRRWQDPAYVRAQARERLHYVMPGETAYVLLRQGSGPGPGPSPTGSGSASPGG